jgi:hypothetical protein
LPIIAVLIAGKIWGAEESLFLLRRCNIELEVYNVSILDDISLALLSVSYRWKDMGFSFLAYNYLVFSLTATAISLVIGLMPYLSSDKNSDNRQLTFAEESLFLLRRCNIELEVNQGSWEVQTGGQDLCRPGWRHYTLPVQCCTAEEEGSCMLGKKTPYLSSDKNSDNRQLTFAEESLFLLRRVQDGDIIHFQFNVAPPKKK